MHDGYVSKLIHQLQGILRWFVHESRAGQCRLLALLGGEERARGEDRDCGPHCTPGTNFAQTLNTLTSQLRANGNLRLTFIRISLNSLDNIMLTARL